MAGEARVVRWVQQEGNAERFREHGVWGDETLAEIFDRAAARDPGKTAVIDATRRVSYGELRDESLRLAQVLVDLGVVAGDPVATQLGDSAWLPALHLACNRIGALFVPLSMAWRGGELRPLLQTVRAPVLIVPAAGDGFDHAGFAGALRDELPELRHVLTQGGSLDERMASTAPLSQERQRTLRPSPDDPAHVMSSSGTTGVPKSSVWSSNDLVCLLVKNVARALRLTPDDVAGGVAPANTGSTGYVFPVLAPLLAGATTAMLGDWSPQAAIDLIEREQCTYATAIPTQMTMLLSLPLESRDLSRFGRFNNAGAPLPPPVAAELEERMGCRIQSIYGTTDGGVPVMVSIDDPQDKRRATVGRVCHGMELGLMAADGSRVPEGEVGEICWRGASKSYGYLNQPDYDAAAWDAEGFFHSGDLGEIDADGYLRVVGRSKDMILRGGTNIFPVEIESLLVQHPLVAAAAIVGVPDERLGERACAVVVPAGDARPDLRELCEFLLERELAKYKLPEELLLLETLPTNAGGKVDKGSLRALAAERLSAPQPALGQGS